jgi:hypothetical protein
MIPLDPSNVEGEATYKETFKMMKGIPNVMVTY